ncbi:YHS domain-containing (seleno)protein [Algirhabdus cladophorae]|uniref:YHS domain-containing (seleno)protein n=1 Tax=Algirhabdus cladophorae TaxID=3377108 RepID=UPI003B84B128
MTTRRQFLSFLAASPVAAYALPAFAMTPKIYATDGVAINGYDPVAYFTQSAPVEGVAEHTSMLDGATFRFANADNKALFDSDPAKYAPQYGGYCAYAVSKGGTASTSPNAWTVHEGKLYLNYNRTVRGIWSRDIPGNITKADANWPNVLNS